MAALLAPIGMAAATGGAGYLGGRLAKKFSDLVGLKKGGSFTPKHMTQALNRATVKKTGVRTVKKNQMVIPKGLATQLKRVARRKPQRVKQKKRRNKKAIQR